jgi:Ca-activated chloride channel homolog
MNPISTEDLSPEDRAIEALLQERARFSPEHDDDDFLQQLEAKLDAECTEATTAAPETQPKLRPYYIATRTLWLAAAACVALGITTVAWFTGQTTGMSSQEVAFQAAPSILDLQGRTYTGATSLRTATADGLRGATKADEGLLVLEKKRNKASEAPMKASDAPAPVPVAQTEPSSEGRMKPAADAQPAAPIPAVVAMTPSPAEPRLRGLVEEKKLMEEKEAVREKNLTRSVASSTLAGAKVFDNNVLTGTLVLEEKDKLRGYLWGSDDSRQFGDVTKNRSDTSRYITAPLNLFVEVSKEALSTFSIDVDTASYANLRRMIQSGRQVPPAAVRVEEMLNYFPYNYAAPQAGEPFSVQVESTQCPWATEHRLVKVALMAKDIDRSTRKAANLVFLVDVSGSMQGEDRLELVKKNLRLLTAQLSPDDTVAIVTYAGNEGLALPRTSGADKATILAKLDSLDSGGSTNGGAGIQLAYKTAHERFLKDGVNRVVLCTDGDFNVGTTGRDDLISMVKQQASEGVFLTVCGYGQGNLNDAMLEGITNKGNGIYHYIDSEREGRKVFQDELFGTLVTVAKDVKLQLEFNPAHAHSYRLIGYDNRMLAKEDFANDKVDAGDIGAGHRVTALYEVVPHGTSKGQPIPLKYQPAAPAAETPKPAEPASPELLTVKLRYKEPMGTTSKLQEIPFAENKEAAPSSDLRFAATVAEFGERLRGHPREGRTVEQLIETAEANRGTDPHGYRAEFIELMRRVK